MVSYGTHSLLLTTLLGKARGLVESAISVLQSTVSNVLMLSLSLTGFLLPNCNAIHVCLTVFPCPWLATTQVKLAFVLVSCSGPYQSCFISTV